MNLKSVVLTVIMASSLVACGKAGRNGPDEFEVVSSSALIVPPNMDLAPPRPGQAQNREIAPSLIAKEILFPKSKVKDKEPPKGAEADMLKKMKYAVDVDVRSNVSRPTVKVAKKRLLIAEILAMADGSFDDDNITVKRTAGK